MPWALRCPACRSPRWPDIYDPGRDLYFIGDRKVRLWLHDDEHDANRSREEFGDSEREAEKNGQQDERQGGNAQQYGRGTKRTQEDDAEPAGDAAPRLPDPAACVNPARGPRR